jgi:tetratricopeptide (TPR) repeat protein
VRTSRQPLGTEPRQLVAIASAHVHLRGGELDEAQKALADQLVPTDSGLRKAFAGANRKLAVELLLAERLEESIAAWGRVREAVPTDEAAHRGQLHLLEVGGMRAVEREDFATAIELWQAALVDQPNHGWLLRNLALAEERLERWSSARDHWERLTRQWKKELSAQRNNESSAELRPRLGVAYRHLAATGEAAGDLHAAASAMERALGLDPSDDDLRLRAAELYLANEDASRAIEHLRRVLVARPNDTRIYLDLGSAYDLKRDDRQAQTYLERALFLEPTNPAIQSALASVYHGRAHRLDDSGLGARAIAEYERAIALAPADPTHPQCLGDLQLKLGQPDEAALAYRDALALRPRDALMRVEIGMRYLARGFEAEAERFFREALRLERGVAMQAAVGIAYLRYQKQAKAAVYLKRVLKGKDPILLALVGTTLMAAGSLDEAIPFLERAVALDSRDVDARLSLAYVYAYGLSDFDRAAFQIEEAERLAVAQGDQSHLAEIAIAREQNEAMRELKRLGRRLPLVKGG